MAFLCYAPVTGGAGSREAVEADAITPASNRYNTWATLKAAIQAGDEVIFLEAETYTLTASLDLPVSTSCTLRPETGFSSKPLLDGNDAAEHCITGVGACSNITIQDVRCDNAFWNGINFRSSATDGTCYSNITISRCDCDNNGDDSGANPDMAFDEGHGIWFGQETHYLEGAALPPTGIAGIVVEDCTADGNLSAGIALDGPHLAPQVTGCTVDGNGTGDNVNTWGIQIRPTGGATGTGWVEDTAGSGIWRFSSAFYRERDLLYVVVMRIKLVNGGAWFNCPPWDLTRTAGDQTTPSPGEFGHTEGFPTTEIYINLGTTITDESQLHVVIAMDGDCTSPLVDQCTASNQSGADGVGIGFDSNTSGGTISNCDASNNAQYGYQLHVTRGTVTLTDLTGDGNGSKGVVTDRIVGNVVVSPHVLQTGT
ncbi:MAG: right-handed parallel beta-helix repeat-containing protein [Gammaproteobacteria bacterium]|nr:right-handed parallel beta-helix repeat-containing protein [Gammaproteobacteria bacterium]